jgi:hypothetical protein
MKLTMSPTRAYFLGLWKGRRIPTGVGVEGRRELVEVFVKLCLDEKFAVADKVKFIDGTITDEGKCYFYNSALRSWLEGEIKKREERLRFKNEFAANYFAGAFDARGGFSELAGKEMLYFLGDDVDEMTLLRLGFRVKKEGSRIAVLAQDFYGWIHPYLKLQRSKKF